MRVCVSCVHLSGGDPRVGTPSRARVVVEQHMRNPCATSAARYIKRNSHTVQSAAVRCGGNCMYKYIYIYRRQTHETVPNSAAGPSPTQRINDSKCVRKRVSCVCVPRRNDSAAAMSPRLAAAAHLGCACVWVAAARGAVLCAICASRGIIPLHSNCRAVYKKRTRA